MGIGTRLRELRETAGLTQGQLAAAVGVTAAAIGNYELEVSFPREAVLYSLFKALHCEPNELFTGHFTEKSADALHLKKYRELDSYGKELVDACTEIEHRRCNGDEGMLIAARNGGAPRRLTLRKRGSASILDEPDYRGGRR